MRSRANVAACLTSPKLYRFCIGQTLAKQGPLLFNMEITSTNSIWHPDNTPYFVRSKPRPSTIRGLDNRANHSLLPQRGAE